MKPKQQLINKATSAKRESATVTRLQPLTGVASAVTLSAYNPILQKPSRRVCSSLHPLLQCVPVTVHTTVTPLHCRVTLSSWSKGLHSLFPLSLSLSLSVSFSLRSLHRTHSHRKPRRKLSSLATVNPCPLLHLPWPSTNNLCVTSTSSLAEARPPQVTARSSLLVLVTYLNESFTGTLKYD